LRFSRSQALLLLLLLALRLALPQHTHCILPETKGG
jgi:hypothetical protein